MNGCTDDHCLTCSDEMLSVRVVSIEKQTRLALVEIEGKQEEVDISLIEQVAPGDILLVHGGVALAFQTVERAS